MWRCLFILILKTLIKFFSECGPAGVWDRYKRVSGDLRISGEDRFRYLLFMPFFTCLIPRILIPNPTPSQISITALLPFFGRLRVCEVTEHNLVSVLISDRSKFKFYSSFVFKAMLQAAPYVRLLRYSITNLKKKKKCIQFNN